MKLISDSVFKFKFCLKFRNDKTFKETLGTNLFISFYRNLEFSYMIK